MIALYDHIKENRKRDELNQYILEFDQDISEFDIIKNLPKVFLESKKQFEDISELGHGLKRYIAIISAILVCRDNCLFIDEIENGLHYTHLDGLWKIILTLSKKLNCQVFATTHSKECIESFYKVSKRLDDEGICFIELGKVDNEIKALVLDKEMFFFEFEQNHEVRGW
ncbi:MAG: ATP-binding protein [Thioploca sp.]|nr:ATP-binding protein [Thioploca sp.]